MSASEKTTVGKKVGVYCLANDTALEWFQVFVRSFRKFNPTLPLTIIPYNAAMSRLKALQEKFQFSIMDEAMAGRFDAIASRVAGDNNPGGTFRKLACFFGEYDAFIFLDSDIGVMMCFDEAFAAFENSACDLVYFDTDLLVFKPEFARTMMAKYNAFGFNSGAFLSRKTAINEDEIMAAVISGEKIRHEFAIWGEQPFLNYLFQVSRRRLTHANAFFPDLTFKPKVWMPFHYNPSQKCFLDPEQGRLPFIHWAGEEYPDMMKPEIFLECRTLGMNPSERRKYQRQFYRLRFRHKLQKFKRRVFAKLKKICAGSAAEV
jgi:lipopolysaccharide biosynthesis glycosyltransferase